MNELSLPNQIIRKFETTEQLIAEGKPEAVVTPLACARWRLAGRGE